MIQNMAMIRFSNWGLYDGLDFYSLLDATSWVTITDTLIVRNIVTGDLHDHEYSVPFPWQFYQLNRAIAGYLNNISQ